MNNKRLMARMGNGLLREVKDSAEAEQIRRDTGDKDMFVFYEDKHSPKRLEQEQPTWGNKPKATGSKQTSAKKQTLLNGILPMEQERKQSPYRTMEYRPWYDWGSNSPWPVRTPDFNPHAEKDRQNKELPSGVKTTVATRAPLTGPLTGHAAASLNPDGSTKIRLLDQGADPAVKLVKGSGKVTSPGTKVPSWMGNLPKQGRKRNYPSQEDLDKGYRENRGWYSEHGQEYARESLGIPEPKVKGGGAKGTEEYEEYREALKWLDEHGQEKANEEMVDVAAKLAMKTELGKDLYELYTFYKDNPDLPLFSFGGDMTDEEFAAARARTRKAIGIAGALFPGKAVNIPAALGSMVDVFESDAPMDAKIKALLLSGFGLSKKSPEYLDPIFYEAESRILSGQDENATGKVEQ